MTLKSHLKPFEPMLAAPRGALRFPCIVQPKYDGIRCVVHNGRALTRKLEPVPNALISAALSNPAFDGLDGELVDLPHDKDVYNRTQEVVMSRDGDPRNVVFFVFDDFADPTLPYERRLARARQRVGGSAARPVPFSIARDETMLAALEEYAHAEGYEGAIVRDPAGLYKFGRATEGEGTLWKMKRMEDDEMRVIRVEERMRNDNAAVVSNTGKTKRGHSKAGMVPTGLLGALVGVSPKWEGEITVGSSNLPRIPLAEAHAMFMGQLVTFKHQPAGAKDAPRFPIYKGLRDARDI